MPRGGFSVGRQDQNDISSGRISILDNYISNKPFEIQILAIGGGGSGGSIYYAGGGGAGGMLESSASVSKTSYSVEIGAGGSGSSSYGSDTTAFNLTAFGGGPANVGEENLSKQVGSGGGWRGSTGAQIGTPGQGFPGANQPSDGSGGGGGGAGEAGNTDRTGAGGDGKVSSITGTSVVYAGGGGGAMNANISYFVGPGGDGGGGSAAADYLSSAVQAQNGSANKGGGGGGSCWHNTQTPGNGGSGIIIFSVPERVQVSFSQGLSELNSGSGQTVGDNKVYTLTSGTGTVTFS